MSDDSYEHEEHFMEILKAESDRELLELAAKAAGVEIKGWTTTQVGEEAVIGFDRYSVETWNPLEDDGDALRLAVKLGINILLGSKMVMAQPADEQSGYTAERLSANHDDPYAATRRAIVRAAAEIGRKMKDGT